MSPAPSPGRERRPPRGVGLFAYVALYALATLALYQWPLLSYVTRVIDLGQPQGWAILTTLELLQALLTAGLMLMLGVVSVRLMKLAGAALFVTNALAQYFMTTYGIVIDPTMIGNILNTNQAEAGGLIHPMLFVSVVLLGALPALAALLLPVRPARRLRTLGALIGVVAALVGTVYAASGTWLWFDAQGSQVGPRTLPWSYLGNGARYAAEYRRRNRPPTPLPDPSLNPPADGLHEVVVLAIGEAARADHLGAFGYARPTTPFTAPRGVIAYPDGRSCATYTLGSVACILSHLGNAARVSDPHEPLPSYLSRAGVESIVRINNQGMPPLPGVSIETVRDVAGCGDACAGPLFDEDLLTGLSERISRAGPRPVFVLLHLGGSHGPEYWRKYPPAFETFTPVCRSTLVAECAPEELINAYDNSIRYTDHVLARLIDLLEALPDTRATLLYVADHGQSLGENGVYLHGLPNAIAPDEQRRVPLMLWIDDDMARARGLDRARLARPVPNPHDMIFHTVLGALGVQSPIYRPEHDLLTLIEDGQDR
ncbi:MAG: phosphoethanolamine--lipid A transferase EptA [Pararhodobacter sp.]